MKEPKTTGEAIQVVRRALYDLARRPEAKVGGATYEDIIRYVESRGWPIPVRDFDRAVERLVEAGAAREDPPPGEAAKRGVEVMYDLTPRGDLEEELRRRPFVERALTSDHSQQAAVGVVSAVAGALAGYLLGKFGP